MFTSKKQNYHHSKLPELGDLGYIEVKNHTKRTKAIVMAYPLNDNVYPYSQGIHTCYFRMLDTGEIKKYSAMWFSSDNFGDN